MKRFAAAEQLDLGQMRRRRVGEAFDQTGREGEGGAAGQSNNDAVALRM